MVVLPPDVALLQQPGAPGGGDGHDAGGAGNSSSANGTGSSRAKPDAAGPWLLVVTAGGYAKRVPLVDVPAKAGRGAQGVIGVKLAPGDTLVGAALVMTPDDDVALASRQGMLVRCGADTVRVCKRSARGVRLQGLAPGDAVQSVAVVAAEHKAMLE
jgi:DNA gyrase subunit A